MSVPVDRLGPARTGWEEARSALSAAAGSACRLLRTIDRPGRPACGEWNVAEVAAHLSHAWQAIPCLAARDLDGLRAVLPEVPGFTFGLPSGALIKPTDDLGVMTTGLVKADPERDLNRLADRIEAAAKSFCEQYDATVDPGPRPWMIEGVTGGPELFACHLLNETFVHTYDLARAAGVKWPIDDQHGALVFRGFLMHVVVAFTTARAAAGAPSEPWTVDLRLADDRRFLICNTAAGVRIKEPGAAPADARMWVRPSTMTLLWWKRRSLRTAVGSGQLAVWGRRPRAARQLIALASGR